MRAFIALELPSDFADDVAELSRQLSAVIDGRFMPPQNRHLTLAFLGDIDQTQVNAAIDAMDAVCSQAAPVPFASDGLGKFGRAHDATLWLGISACPELVDLVDRLRDALATRDVPFDNKTFKPHITLARRACIPKEPLPELAFPQDDEATHVTLFKSKLEQSGAVYQPLHTIDLDA